MAKIAVIGIAGESVFLSVDRFHQGGETVKANSLHTELGGKGINQAVAAARYGAEVSFLCASDEKTAKELCSFAEKESIKLYTAKKGSPSPFAVILTDAAGNNQVTVYQGAELNPDDVRRFEDEIISSDILLLTNEVPQEVNSAAVSVAAANGVKVILNPAPSRELPPEMIGKVWLFTPNEFETNGLDGMSNVITTLGKNGCRIERTGEVIPSYTYGDTVDTTGAGDTFSGVLAACLASGDTLENSCRIACIAAGIEVTSKGVMDAIPYRDLINKAMKRDIDFKK